MSMSIARFYDHWDLLVGEGRVPRYAQIHRFGENLDVDADTDPEDLWPSGGLYTGFPDTEGEVLRVTSSSAEDSSAGTGIQTIEIDGLNHLWREVSEVVTMDGINPVVTENRYKRVNRVEAITAGSATWAVGTINVRHNVTTANLFATIQPGASHDRSATFTVPQYKKASVRSIKLEVQGIPGVTGYAALMVRKPGGVWIDKRRFLVNAESLYVDDIIGGIQVDELSDIVMRVENLANQNNTQFIGGFDLTLSDFSRENGL